MLEDKINRIENIRKPPEPRLERELIEDIEKRQPEVLALIEAASIFLDEKTCLDLKKTTATSNFFAEGLKADPGLIEELYKEDLFNSAHKDIDEKLKEELKNAASERELALTLRQFKLKYSMAICFRELSGRADLKESMTSLSNLAEGIIRAALDFLYSRALLQYGFPLGAISGEKQEMLVLAMGKLGAKELNFSSDIDLIYSYPEEGESSGPSIISNETFFIRLARKLNSILGNNTEGPLYRIDLRLRPFGENGPLIMHFDAMEFYYQSQGREWERYALIKCRPISGKKKDGEELLKRLRPFVYRKYLDFGVFDSLREMKEAIVLETRKKGMEENIKTGSGGIREIEFFGQAFQLLRGGVILRLQERKILKILESLAFFHFIDKKSKDELIDAYYFLRYTEHRIQAWEDRQTHLLPENKRARTALYSSMGFESWENFKEKLEDLRFKVGRHFQKLLAQERDREGIRPMSALWKDHKMEEDKAIALLTQAGYMEAETIYNMLSAFRREIRAKVPDSEGKKRLDMLMPPLLELCSKNKEAETALERILNLFRIIQRRSTYFALFLEYPSALNHLIHLASASPWIMDFISLHPILLDELLDPRTLYQAYEKKELDRELEKIREDLDPEDLEARLESLCTFKQACMLRIAAADISGEIPLMKISDRLTDLAETILSFIVNSSYDDLVKRYGKIVDKEGNYIKNKGFAVIAYGKLGGIELGYGSDLDLVFLHDDIDGYTEKEEKRILADQFFTRLGQRVVHCLKSSTRAGSLYKTDLRLRPDGNSGTLVVPISAFKEYQDKQAWTWEHQALSKARVICGEKHLAEEFKKIRHDIISLKRDKKSLREDIVSMREKLRERFSSPEENSFDLKHERGGIIDIEFLVQYMILAHAYKNPLLSRWTDNVRMLETLSETGIMKEEEATFLRSAYLILRVAIHRQNLQNKPSLVPKNNFMALSHKVIKIWEKYMKE